MSKFSRKFAIGIVSKSRIASIPARHLSIGEARAFQRAYNSFDDDRQAVILRHPLSAAVKGGAK
jgi:hypothetical protein